MTPSKRPVLVVEDDPWTRVIQVVLDPDTSPERRAAFADFMSTDKPDFDDWCRQVRQRAGIFYPSVVQMASSREEMHGSLHDADALVVESFVVGANELRNAPHLKGDLDFSFSGLKTAVLRYVRGHEGPLSEREIADVAASFQRVVVASLIEKLFDAARRHGVKSVGVAGGVSANSRLRAELEERGARREIPTFLPSLQLSTDNAAMIAAAGLRKFRAGITSAPDLNADAALTLG